MNIKLMVTLDLEHRQGKFEARADLIEALIQELDTGGPGTINGANDGEYECTTFQIEELTADELAPRLPKDVRRYIGSLIRMDIRKDERGLAKFAPRPGQSPEDAAAARKKLEDALTRHRAAYAALKEK
jgi:hypothetical protein